MELQHFLEILIVDDEIATFFIKVLRDREATEDFSLAAIDCAKECPHYDLLVFWLPEIVVKDIGADGGVDHTVKLLNREAEVEVGKFLQLRSSHGLVAGKSARSVLK